MNLTPYSRNKILKTFELWRVPKDFAEPMYNYLVHGFEPGSCFTAVLANDFARAMLASHPANTVEAFKALTKWILDNVPSEARGSAAAVSAWCKLPTSTRRSILEDHKIVLTEAEEVWMTLQGAPTHEPHLY
jgi:hypothetical protein